MVPFSPSASWLTLELPHVALHVSEYSLLLGSVRITNYLFNDNHLLMLTSLSLSNYKTYILKHFAAHELPYDLARVTLGVKVRGSLRPSHE